MEQDNSINSPGINSPDINTPKPVVPTESSGGNIGPSMKNILILTAGAVIVISLIVLVYLSVKNDILKLPTNRQSETSTSVFKQNTPVSETKTPPITKTVNIPEEFPKEFIYPDWESVTVTYADFENIAESFGGSLTKEDLQKFKYHVYISGVTSHDLNTVDSFYDTVTKNSNWAQGLHGESADSYTIMAWKDGGDVMKVTYFLLTNNPTTDGKTTIFVFYAEQLK